MGIRESGTDPLTGLTGKAEFEEALAEALSSGGDKKPVSLAFFDIDHFMQVNTEYGHAKGDDVLAGIAAHFGKELPGDRCSLFRIGGDEFAVVLVGTEKEQAFLLLESARKTLAGLKDLGAVSPRPSVSIGVATYPDDGTTRQEVTRKADDALFRAKSGGRDRVALAREERKVPKTSHYTQGQLDRLAALATQEGVGEAELLREALDDLLKKYKS